jgi:thermitase
MNMKKSMITALALLATSQWSSSVLADDNGYIIKLKKGATQKSVRFMRNKSVSSIKPLNVALGNFYKMTVREGAEKSIEMIANDPAVEYIEKNQTYSIDPVPSMLLKESAEILDDEFKSQWGLQNDGKNSGSWFSRGVAGEDTNVLKAWDLTKGKKEIIVAVIDTGVDYTHQDLAANMWVNELEKNGEEGVDDCAGVIGALHDTVGVRGVMADVRIMALKFLTGSGSGTTEDAIMSIDYAVKAGAHVLSNSWGGGGASQALEDSIQAASDAGVIFVAAAGNSYANNDSTETYPANYKIDNVISVGAMNGKGGKSSFSNYGKESVHIFAPGSRIYSTTPKNKYKKLDGTSMAAPFVSGAMGLLLSLAPGMTPLEARERLEATAIRGKLDKFTRSGRMDIFKLLEGL